MEQFTTAAVPRKSLLVAAATASGAATPLTTANQSPSGSLVHHHHVLCHCQSYSQACRHSTSADSDHTPAILSGPKEGIPAHLAEQTCVKHRQPAGAQPSYTGGFCDGYKQKARVKETRGKATESAWSVVHDRCRDRGNAVRQSRA